jgi:hypothetical protein
MKKLIVALLFFAFGIVSGYYFFSLNYSQKEAGLLDFHNQDFLSEVTGFTEGIIISINENMIKIDSEKTGKTASFPVKEDIDLTTFSEGDLVRVEVQFDFEEQIFIIKKIQKI